MYATFILANDMQFLVCNQSLGMRQTMSVTHAGGSDNAANSIFNCVIPPT